MKIIIMDRSENEKIILGDKPIPRIGEKIVWLNAWYRVEGIVYNYDANEVYIGITI
jgi:hypothetical protein